MDFRSLSRRELQTLCKKNKIPANQTNVAMADALAAIPQVEGIEEFLNAEGSEVQESTKEEEIICSEIPRTALRTSTRRKAIEDDSSSSQPLTRRRRGTGARCSEEPNQENKDLNVALTPALPSGRRRVVAASACKKVDFQITENVENDDNLGTEKNQMPETPAVPNSQKRVAAASARRKTETRNNGTTERRASTRRSIRLLEKNMESLSLMEEGKTEPITIQLSFEEMPKSKGTEEEAHIEIGPKKTDVLERKSDTEQDVSMKFHIDDPENNETKYEENISMAEPDRDPDILTCLTALVSGKSSNDVLERKSDTEQDVSKKFHIDDPENNETKYGENISMAEPDRGPDVLTCLTALVSGKTSIYSEDETDVPDNNLDIKCFSEDDGTEEASEDNGPEIDDIDSDAKISLPPENFVPKVDNLMMSSAENSGAKVEENTFESVDIQEESLTKVDDVQNECNNESDSPIGEIFGDKKEILDADIEGDKKDLEVVSVEAEDSAKLSQPLENVEYETNLVVQCVMKVDDGQNEYIYESETIFEENFGDDKVEAQEAGIGGDIQDLEMNLVQAEDVTAEKSTAELSGYVSEDLVDVKVQLLMDEGLNGNITSLDSLTNVECETLVDVSVTSAEEIPVSNSNGMSLAAPFAAEELAGQFPRPTITTKSPAKELTMKLLMDVSDGEGEDEEPDVSKKDLSLRQLRKMFKEQLQLSKGKMDNNSKVGKVRTALQPLPENRMENRF